MSRRTAAFLVAYGLAVSPASGLPLIFDDGRTHYVNGPATSVFLENGSTVNIGPSADIAGNVTYGPGYGGGSPYYTFLNGRLNVLGGVIRGDIDSSGLAGADLNIVGDAKVLGNVHLDAGTMDAVFANDIEIFGNIILSDGGGVGNGTSTFTGGRFRGEVHMGDVNELLISGGRFDSSISMSSLSSGVIVGGKFNSNLELSDGAYLDLYGGRFSSHGEIHVDNARLNIYGRYFALQGDRLTGYLSDGSRLDTRLLADLSAVNLVDLRKVNVPEPSTLMLMCAGLAAVLIGRRRRQLGAE